jgi:hypothetical protein
VIVGIMRRQSLSVDLFKDFEVSVVFWGYDGNLVRLAVLWFSKSSVDLI